MLNQLQSMVTDDFKSVGENYIKLIEKYSSAMHELFNGNLGDIPAQANHPYNEIQHKMTCAHVMRLDGLLVDKVAEEPQVYPFVTGEQEKKLKNEFEKFLNGEDDGISRDN
jgi:hypothetical protein